MNSYANRILDLAVAESSERVRLKKPLIYNSKRDEVTLYDEYIPMCNPELVYEEGRGYKLADGCGNEIYTDDKIKCATYYDKLSLINSGGVVESFDDALSFVRKLAYSKFQEIWDDEDEIESIERTKALIEKIGQKIEEYKLI